MKSRASLLGHPIHQILVVFPLGILGASVAFDLYGALTHKGYWNVVSDHLIPVGIGAGLLAAVFGLIDWSGIPDGTRAKRVGLMHAGANVIALLLFFGSWWLRRPDPSIPGQWVILLSCVAIATAALGGWLGGELVGRMGVGVHDGAHLDSPSSLSGRPASEKDR